MATPRPDDEPAGAADDLDTQVRRADPDRWLATRFIADEQARADVIALYAYDAELTRAPKAASNALAAEIRLTWWREVLDQVFGGGPVRRHPVAQALADAVARRGLPRAPLEAMIDARIEALGAEALDGDDALAWADQVGGSAAMLAAQVLGVAEAGAEAARPAGILWGLALLRRSGRLPRTALLEEALARASRAPVGVEAFPAVAHATLARADVRGRPSSDLGKRARLLWAVLTGRL